MYRKLHNLYITPPLFKNPPFIYGVVSGMFYCGIHMYMTIVINIDEWMMEHYYGTVILYLYCQDKPDICDIFSKSHLLPQTLGDD